MTGRASTRSSSARAARRNRSARRRDLWLLPNGDFIPLFSDDEFMQIKTFARAGMVAQLHPPGSGRPVRPAAAGPIEGTFDRVHLDLVEREGERLDGQRRSSMPSWPTTRSSESIGSDGPLRRRDRIPGQDDQRQRARHGSTRPTPARSCFRTSTASRTTCLPRVELAFSAMNDPALGRVHRPGPDADRRRGRGLPLLKARPAGRHQSTSSTGSPTGGRPARVGSSCRHAYRSVRRSS